MGPLKCCGNGARNTVNETSIKNYIDNFNNRSAESTTIHMINFSLPKQKEESQQRIKILK